MEPAEFVGDSLDKVNWDLDKSLERKDVNADVYEWYSKHGYMLYQVSGGTREAQRELRRILFPNGGGDIS